MPSSAKARNAIFDLMDNTGTGPVYDLGSGWGGLVVPLAKKYPDRKIVGYELSFVPWLVSFALKNALGLNNLDLYRKNFLQADLSGAAVLLCYLHTGSMADIVEKLVAEGHAGGLLISNNFALPGCRPEKVVEISDLYRSPIYRYRLTQLAGGLME